MFTGLVEGRGTIIKVDARESGLTLTIEHPNLVKQLQIGDSIAVNGCCLTAVSIDGNCCQVELVPETLERTSFGSIREGDRVNLELSLRANARLGGHFVQGHVDGLGTISEKRQLDDGSWWVSISAPKDCLRYIVEKGSIAVDGVSLTVAALAAGSFSFAMIPHTAEVTTLGTKAVGSPVHLEVDILAKYVERLTVGA